MTQTIPQTIKLDAEDVAALSQLSAREKALSQMTADFQERYEQRAAALQQDTQLTWMRLGEKYGIDLRNVLYAASPDFSEIIPTQMRFGVPAA